MTPWSLLARLQRSSPEPPPLTDAPLLDVEGFCPVCEQDTRFRSWTPWLRDGFICVQCHSLPRERAFYTVLERVRPDWRELRVHESSPSTPDGKLASRRRARRLTDGSVEHLEPPDFHLNPIDAGGSLVTFDWGYDLADYLDAHAELNTTIFALDDLSRGIRAELIEVLVSRKAASPAF